MQPVPIDLPLRPSEASALADMIFQALEERQLNDDARNRLAGQAATLNLTSLQPYFGSLEADPVHSSAYYLAVDGLAGAAPEPLLLHIAPSSSPATAIFANPLLIGRMRPAGQRELVVNAIPFASRDWENIQHYAERLGRTFLPRPQGPLPAIATGNRHPEISLPAAFRAFRTILKTTGVNMASTTQLSATREMTTDAVIAARDGETPTAAGHTRVSIRHLIHAGIWAAVRAGWREGYTAEADHIIITGNTPDEIARSLEAGKEAIRHAAWFTKFTTDTSRMFELEADERHPRAWTEAQVEERFGRIFSAAEQSWILGEFGKPIGAGEVSFALTPAQIRRLAVKFGRSLQLNEELYDFIKEVKADSLSGRAFDFEPSLDEADTLTTPAELMFCMQWLKLRGRPAQLVPPNLGFKKRQAYPERMETTAQQGLGLAEYAAHKMWPELCPRVTAEFGGDTLRELGARVGALAAVARHFNGTLSVHSGSGKQAAVLETIGKATAGRVNYKISGELQLQLFDVLSEQPETSPWRQLFDRMAARANQFAASGAFGEESELAAHYLKLGKGNYLGDAARGRVDGNLFQVFWLGNLVGSRDSTAPDGDNRFFKEKLDELPAGLLEEVRKRNAAYVVWLAEHLR